MKHQTASIYTKKALSASLKRFMEQKPFSKITVSEIITDCGVNRKTFYYHFSDIHSLLKWTLEQETVEILKQFNLLTEYEDAIVFVIHYLNENKHILNCLYDGIGRDELKRFLYPDFLALSRSIIEGVEQQMNIYLEEGFKDFLEAFYAESVVNIIVAWFRDGKEYDEETAISYISRIFKNSLPAIIKNSAGTV